MELLKWLKSRFVKSAEVGIKQDGCEKDECLHCKYYISITNSNYGNCMRYPPTLLKGEGSETFESYPKVIDFQWCGEYKKQLK